MQEKHNEMLLKFDHISEREMARGLKKTGCEAGGDQPAVFDTRVSGQSVPRASFSNHRFNG